MYDVFEFLNDRMKIENIHNHNYKFFYVLLENWFNKSILIYLGVFIQPSTYTDDNLLSNMHAHDTNVTIFWDDNNSVMVIINMV